MRSLLILVLLALVAGAAQAEVGVGPRLGLINNDEFFLGVQGEFGPIFRRASLIPAVDFGLGSEKPTLIDVALRLPLIPLPESGLMFYGQAAPTWQVSPHGEFGLSIGLGLIIPMQDSRRYNFEYRWGIGDIPDHRISMTVMFGL